jgi:hypothetical protein
MRIRTEPPKLSLPACLIAPGLAATKDIAVTVEDFSGFDLQLDLEAQRGEADRAGQFVCVRLEVRRRGGLPVTTEAVRSIPVAAIVRQAVRAHVGAVDIGQPEDGPVADALLGKGEPAGERKSHGRRGHTVMLRSPPWDLAQRAQLEGPSHDVLFWVAYVYRRAAVLGDRPTKAVESTFQLPRSTAGRWVAMARRHGHLGAAERPGKAGG